MEAARSSLDISTHSVDGAVAVTLAGRGHADALEQVKTVLERLRASPGKRLHLRLAELDFCETPVAWELLEFVRDVKDGGAEVVLESPPDMVVSTVLLLADVRDDLGLRADGDGRDATRR